MPRWPQEIAEAVLFDIRFGLKFRVGARSRPATDQEIDLVARTTQPPAWRYHGA